MLLASLKQRGLIGTVAVDSQPFNPGGGESGGLLAIVEHPSRASVTNGGYYSRDQDFLGG